MSTNLTKSIFCYLLTFSLLGLNVNSQQPSTTELSIQIQNDLYGIILEDPSNPGRPFTRGIDITKANGTILNNRTKPLGFNNLPGNFGEATKGMQIKIQIVGLKYNFEPHPNEKCWITLLDSSGNVIPNSLTNTPGGVGNMTTVQGVLGRDGLAVYETFQWYQCTYIGFLGKDFSPRNGIKARFEFGKS
jgi:hypothetical protein